MQASRVLAALMLVFSSCLALAQQPAEPPARSQVSPGDALAALYPEAGHIGLAIAIAPDPQVPRYRRLFDLNVQAITLGMLNDGYVLDRYAFPWSKGQPDNGAFGLMIFRCDAWRGRACMDPATRRPQAPRRQMQGPRIRALYFITDTATWGVATPPLLGATRQIRSQLNAPRVGLLQFPGCPSSNETRTLVLLGPTFSGAMDSVGEHVGEVLGAGITDVCLVSGFTTVSSNRRAPLRYPHLHYARLALDDGVKLLGLARLARSFGYFDPGARPDPTATIPSREVAFLTEASTFGYGVCSPSESMSKEARDLVADFCAYAQTLYFPAAIADIRLGLNEQRERQRNNVQSAMEAALPNEHLTLDVGADNGSEYPDNGQSKLTAASQQLSLDAVLNRLEQSDPKMVVVVATDVRDRLFLFEQLRSRLPSALLIDLETDVLLAHPDFLHASRGAITVASANLFVRGGRLFGCEPRRTEDAPRIRIPLASWALDGQGMLADAVSRLDESNPPLTTPPCVLDPQRAANRVPVLHVVTLKGLRQISRAFESGSGNSEWARKARLTRMQRQFDLCTAQWFALFCCVVIVLPWFRVRLIQGIVSPWLIASVVGAASAAVWYFAMQAAYGGEDPESGNALRYWSGSILFLAVLGLFMCLRRLHECCAHATELPRRYRVTIGAAGLLACALAAVPALLRCLTSDASPALDEDLVTRLALDIGQGLAYHVVTAIGVFAALFLMIALATGACIMTRNNTLLASRGSGRDCDPGLRTPRFSRACIGAMAIIITLIALPSLATPLGGARLSIFGPLASQIATFVLVITTFGASILTVVAIHSSRRICTMAAHIARCVAPDQVDPKNPREYPGFWPTNDWQPSLFAVTPVMVSMSPELVAYLNKTSWKALVTEFLSQRTGKPDANDGKHRRAVYALLASEVSLYRWFVGGAVLCALASVCTAYLFPLEADPLIMWNLGVLVAHALLAGYVATAFERDGVLSNILCNKPKKAAFSASLFAYAALPFLALGFAIAVSQVPGVVDWGGGVLALLGAVGVHL